MKLYNIFLSNIQIYNASGGTEFDPRVNQNLVYIFIFIFLDFTFALSFVAKFIETSFCTVSNEEKNYFCFFFNIYNWLATV